MTFANGASYVKDVWINELYVGGMSGVWLGISQRIFKVISPRKSPKFPLLYDLNKNCNVLTNFSKTLDMKFHKRFYRSFMRTDIYGEGKRRFSSASLQKCVRMH